MKHTDPTENPAMTSIRVTRIEAAERQLGTAIALYFREEDPVSIHTLAMAAREILRVLGKASGKGPLILGEEFNFRERIQPSKAEVERYFRHMKKESNFFKHSSSDPNEAIELYTAHNGLRLYECVIAHTKLTGTMLDVGPVLLCYVALRHLFLFGREHTVKAQQIVGIEHALHETPRQFARAHGDKILRAFFERGERLGEIPWA